MAKRLISLAGKVVRKSVADLDADRYVYLSLDQAEPNPGNPDFDGSLFFSNADGQRGFTKRPELQGLRFDDNTLNEAPQTADYALILHTNPTAAGYDSVGYRQLGDLAFTNESEITLQVVTENSNTTTEGIVINKGTLGGANSNNYGLEINGFTSGATDQALFIADNTVSLIEGDLQITGAFNMNTTDGDIRGTGITGLNSIELLVIDSALAPVPYRIGKRAFNFTAFDPPTLREVTNFTIASGDLTSNTAKGAITPDGINARFLKLSTMTDRTSSEGPYKTDFRRALVVNNVGIGLTPQNADSVGYRTLSDLALYDSTNDDIRMPRLFVRNPGVGFISAINNTIPLVFQDSVTKEYKILDIDVTNLDNTFETLHSVSGRAEQNLDIGETNNQVIFSNTIKLRGNTEGRPLNPVVSNTVLVAQLANLNDSAVVAIRQAEDIAFDDSLITLDFVLERGDTTNSYISLGGDVRLPAKGTIAGEPRVLALRSLDSVGVVTLNTIAFTGQETDTLQSVTDRGDSTNTSITTNGLRITAENGIGLQIDSAALGASGTVNRFLVYDTSSGNGQVILRELDNNLLDGEDDTLQSVTNRGHETTLEIQALGFRGDSSTVNYLTVLDSASVENRLRVNSLTETRLVFVGAQKQLVDDASLTYDGATLQLTENLDVDGSTNLAGTLTVSDSANVSSLRVTDLTKSRVVFVSDNGELVDDTTFTYDSVSNTLSVDNISISERSTFDSVYMQDGLRLNQLNGTTSLDVLTIDANNEVQKRTIESTAFTGETLTTVTQTTRPAGYNTTPTPLYLNGGISISAPQVDTNPTYNLLVLQNPTGDSVEYLQVSSNILDGSALGLDEVLINDPVSGRNIYLTGTGGIIADSAQFSELLVSNEVIILGNLRVDGATTIINSTELSVNDKNIVLADSAQQPSDAHGGGITLKTGVDSSVNLYYSAVEDRWVFDHGLKVDSDLQINKNLNVDGLTTLDSTVIDGTRGLTLTNLYQNNTTETTALMIFPDGTVEGRNLTTSAFTDPNLQAVTDQGYLTTKPIIAQGIRADSANFTQQLTVGGPSYLSGIETTASLYQDVVSDASKVLLLSSLDSVEYLSRGDLLDAVTLQYVTDHGSTTTNPITVQRLTITNLTEKDNLFQVLAYSNDSVETTTLEQTAHTPLSYFTLDQAAVTGSYQLAQQIDVTQPINLDAGLTAALTNPGTPVGAFDVVRLVDAGGTDSAFRVTLQSGATKPAEDYTWAFVLGNGDSTGVQDVNIGNQLYIDRTQLPAGTGWDTSLVVPVFNTAKVTRFDSVGYRTLNTAANYDKEHWTLQQVTDYSNQTIGGVPFASTSRGLKFGNLIANVPVFSGAYAPSEDGYALFINPSAQGGADSVGYRDVGAFAFRDTTNLQTVTTAEVNGDSTTADLTMHGIIIRDASKVQIQMKNSSTGTGFGDWPAIDTNDAVMYDSVSTNLTIKRLAPSAFEIPDLQTVTQQGDSTNVYSTFAGGMKYDIVNTGGLPLVTASDIETNGTSYYEMLLIQTGGAEVGRVKRGEAGVVTRLNERDTLRTVTDRGASTNGTGADSARVPVVFSNYHFRLTGLGDSNDRDTVVSINPTTGNLSRRSVTSITNLTNLDDVTSRGFMADRGIGIKELRIQRSGLAGSPTEASTFPNNYDAVISVVSAVDDPILVSAQRGQFDSSFNVDGLTTLDSTTIDAVFGNGFSIQNLGTSTTNTDVLTISGNIVKKTAFSDLYQVPNLQSVTEQGRTTTLEIQALGVIADSATIANNVEVGNNLTVLGSNTNLGRFNNINHQAQTGSSYINVQTAQSPVLSHFISFDSADNGSGDAFTEMRFGVKSIFDGFVTNQLVLSGQDGASITTDYSSTDLKLDNRTNGAATASKLLFTSGNTTSASEEYEYGEIRTVFTGRTAGSETARMELRVAGNDFGAAGTRVKIDSAGEVLVTDTGKLKLDTGVKLQDANNRTLVIYDSAGAVLWGNV